MPAAVIELTGDFEGGNPQDDSRIVALGEDSYRVFPFSEDEDPNYKFRVDLKARNRSGERRTISLALDWMTTIHQEHRDCIYLAGPGTVNPLSVHGRIQDTLSVFSLPLEPGESHISLHPKYTYADYLRFIGDIPDDDGIEKICWGRTDEGREIWALRPSPHARRKDKIILAVARVHPYETAGSFCAEGIIEAYLAKTPEMLDLLLEHDLVIVPMANPDGVSRGYCKRTALAGIDLSKELDEKDSACRILKDMVDCFKPLIYMEFHNWMFKEQDGIYFLDRRKSKRFERLMSARVSTGKTWNPMLRRRLFAIEPTGIKRYAQRRFGSMVACLEYPWFGRDSQKMKALGRNTVYAMARI